MAQNTKSRKSSAAPGLAELQKMTDRFAPTPLRVDTSKLSAADKQALVKLVEAGRIIDDIFLKQYWAGNPALYARLQKDATPLGKVRLQYFWINKGPWSVLDEFQGLSARRSRGETQGRQFLSRGHDQGELRELDCILAERRTGASQGLLHGCPLEERHCLKEPRRARVRSLQRRVQGRPHSGGQPVARSGQPYR